MPKIKGKKKKQLRKTRERGKNALLIALNDF